MTLRSLVLDLIPPILLRPAQQAWRRLHGLGGHNFYGAWPRFADVPATGESNDPDSWAQTLPTKWRESFKPASGPIRDDNGLLILPLLASQFSGPLTVLDFGGGPGAGLSSIRNFTRLDPAHLSYVLVETPAMCRTVRGEIELQGGKVVEEIPATLPHPLIVNARASLQYIDDYRAALSRLTRLAPEFLVLSHVSMSDGPTYARQNLNTPHRKVGMWVFNRAEFVADMRTFGYRLAFSVDHDLPLTHGNAPGPSAITSTVFVPDRS